MIQTKNLILNLTAVILLLFQSCIPISSIFLGMPDSKDLKRFNHNKIHSSSCFEFADGSKQQQLYVNDWSKDIPFFVPLDELAKGHRVRSFLVIQNDSVKYQYYGQNINLTTLSPSYSIAKSFTTTLIGIAIDEGFIKSEQDLVINYIPELKNVQHAELLTIEHLLNHASGLHYSLVIDAKLYYGTNMLKVLSLLKFDHLPGTKQHYLNINFQLLGIILQRATKQSPAQYLEDKIWKPIGMCTDGLWSIDKKNKLEKTYCCLGATALDYAKFGRLYANKGNWNGQQIVSENWYNKSIERDSSNGSSFNFNYSWHIGLKEYGDYMAIGLYKQHIYIHPNKNLIIVLLLENEKRLLAERVNWWYVFRQIADQL